MVWILHTDENELGSLYTYSLPSGIIRIVIAITALGSSDPIY